LEKVIKDKFHELDSLAYQVKLEADRAMQEVKENPEQAPNIYQRYVNAAQKQIMQGKQKAQNVASKTKVNVAMTHGDSMFPNIHLPGGISNKATEWKELGSKGDSWESPVFKLGSAAASTDIPKAGKVIRKDHSVTEGGVRGPQNIGNTQSATNQLRDPSAQATGASNGSTTGNTNGFSTQVDQAFSAHGTQGLNGSNGAANGNGKTNGNTTLGSRNPVLTGSV